MKGTIQSHFLVNKESYLDGSGVEHFQWKKQFKGAEVKRDRQSSRHHIYNNWYVAHSEEWEETGLAKVGLVSL